MADAAAQRARPPPNRRRDKPQLSCDPCRRQKLKCDRQHPCGACSRRDITSSCNYATPLPRTPGIHQSVPSRQPTSLHDRISELESLVITLMHGESLPNLPTPGSSRPSPPSQHDATLAKDPGTLKLHASRTSYVQSIHWEAVLTQIKGLKEDLVTDSRNPTGSQLFYGPNRHASREEILAAVPSRAVVDRLMAFHFDSSIVTPYIIHRNKFLREYETFWKDPSASSMAWIGLMFSMLYIAAQLRIFAIDANDQRADSLKAEQITVKDGFLDKAIQCLVLARYTTGGPHVLETLIMILTGEFIFVKRSATDGWLLTSMILHLAMRMGYHRDSDHFPGISLFEGEMRRRIWTTILQLDLSLSLETGLPRSATDSHIDTKEPRNMRDCDFDEDTTEMPPPRPETEWTPILPLVTRARLISVMGLVCNINSDINPPSHEDIAKVDALLENLRQHAIPPALRWQSAPHAITDSPNMLVQRVSVETTYYKARILLHRRSLIGYSPGKSSKVDSESVQICLESALKILSFQQMLHEETQAFGRLYQLRWKVNHIFNQDVLLATSLLCLYFQDVDKFEQRNTIQPGTSRTSSAEEVRQQLTISHKLWREMSTTSAQAGKVAKALSIVLRYSEQSTEDYSSAVSYDLLMDFDAVPLDEFGATFNNQYLPSGFYSPLTFFESVLENQGS